MKKTENNAYRNKQKRIAQRRRRYLRKRKPKRQGSRNQSGKRLPVRRPIRLNYNE